MSRLSQGGDEHQSREFTFRPRRSIGTCCVEEARIEPAASFEVEVAHEVELHLRGGEEIVDHAPTRSAIEGAVDSRSHGLLKALVLEQELQLCFGTASERCSQELERIPDRKIFLRKFSGRFRLHRITPCDQLDVLKAKRTTHFYWIK